MSGSSGECTWVVITPVVVAGILKDAPLVVHLVEDSADAENFDQARDSVREALEARGADILSERPLAPTPTGTASPLTGREVEVLRLAALGTEAPRIADELGTSLHTVRNHIRNLCVQAQRGHEARCGGQGHTSGYFAYRPFGARARRLLPG
ncbi:MAG: LuxR C-terminal-related transcriptional regulator [Actinomycetia bacterium]|nr:LuxR C-terminal-related transcriptional regulator [Actinomycetes bacterium]